MDVLDQVRDLRPTYPSSTQAPRVALQREIARSRRARPLRRVALVSLGGAAVAAAVVTAVAVSPPGLVSQPSAASAAVYLTETAASIRATATTTPAAVAVTSRQLGMVGGPNTVFAPFGDIRAGAVGAVVSESSSTYRRDEGGVVHVVDEVRFHSTEVYGDEGAVAAAWDGYYGNTDIGPLGTAPVAELPYTASAREEKLPVATTGFPDDPAAFLAAWTQGMQDRMAEEKAERATLVEGDPEASGVYDAITERYDVPTADNMIFTLATSPAVHTAPAEYRATFLEALALAPGIVVDEDSAAVKVLAYSSDTSRYRMSIDPAAGAITQIDEYLQKVPGSLWSASTKNDPLVDVGSAGFLPDDIPSRSWTFHVAQTD